MADKKTINKADDSRDNQRLYISELLKQHEEFIVIGLTGRVGSGCTEAANILSSSFTEIGLPPIYPGDMGLANDNERDRRILYRYAAHHWLKFDVIKVRTIITSFLMLDMIPFCEEVADVLYASDENKTKRIKQGILVDTYKRLKKDCPDDETIRKQFTSVYNACKGSISNDPETVDTILAEIGRVGECWQKIEPLDETIIPTSIHLFEDLYYIVAEALKYTNRTLLLCEIDVLLDYFSARAAFKWWETVIGEEREEDNEETLNQKLEKIKKVGELFASWNKLEKLDFYKYVFVHNIVPSLSDSIHDCISTTKGSVFTELYQKYGNSIRRFGKVSFSNGEMPAIDKIGENVFSIPRRINLFIKSMRHPFSRSFAKPTRIVIDSIKSVLEANYLRDRYAAFYLFSISAEETVRIERLTKNKNLTLREIHCIDWNEYSNYGAEKYRKFLQEKEKSIKPGEEAKKEKREAFYKTLIEGKTFDEDELVFLMKVEGETISDSPRIYDQVRKDAYRNKLYHFVLQDVDSSIQNADVYISNNHTEKTKNMDLRWELVRNISLISHPGLLLPTPIERCMQAAFTAKANSGCLSRQVGAVVTDPDYNILSIGWNDVPCGDVSCSRKNLIDIVSERDLQAYTNYEIFNKDFRERIKNIYEAGINTAREPLGRLLGGLPWRYCFKDVHIEGKQPMRSRAMHAEEKALASVQDKAVGGCLFTTSSPCEMCSKNAKNHRIKKIYYIEPYPGISEDQYSNSGDISNRAEHILFTGAIGRAYTQMYTPIMPHKDILEYLGL
ncbi:MAG: hypothetical protein IJK63_12205 [Oscillospiraceae bacterium]|nr:hypothetical protein [Oscillospiraceae bacterium]